MVLKTNKKKERLTCAAGGLEACSAGLPPSFSTLWAEPAEPALPRVRVGWPRRTPRVRSSLSGVADEPGPPVSRVFFFLAP
jgi:hypothetical protein